LKLTQQLRFKKPSPFLFLQEIGALEFQDALDEVKKAQKPEASVRKTSFFEFSLCLSRACLGKMIVFIYKWLQKAVVCRSAPTASRGMQWRLRPS
jgi:hypothetical protein